MASRRNNSYGNGVNYNKNNTRGPSRERNYRQNPKHIESDSRVIQLLSRIFNDEDDNSFTRRVANANQLLKQLEDSRSTISDSLEFRQEQMQLLDVCVHDEGLRRTIEFPKAPSALKNTLIKIVSGLACYTRLDLALSWVFDRLSVWPASMNDVHKDREWKKWLLRLLKQILVESAEDQYTYKQTMEMSPMILAGVISFLDTMDSPDYLPIIVEILVYFSESCQNLFGQRFKDIIDLLVGWNMDPELSDSKRAIILESYTKFDMYWANYLSFAMELLSHFLNDIASTEDKKLKQCLDIFGCFEAILQTISPFLANSQRMLGSAIDKLLVNVLSLTDAFKDHKWIDTSITILLTLASFDPVAYRTYQYQIYHIIVEQPIRGTQAFMNTLMHFLDLWNYDIDENIVFHLLQPDTSPLLSLRKEGSLITLVRFLVQVPISTTMRATINQMCIKECQHHQLYIQQYFDQTDEAYILKRTQAAYSKHTNLLINSHDQSKESTSEEILFTYFMLLTMGYTWPEHRHTNMLISTGLLCALWQHKVNDVFDSCFDLFKTYGASLNYMVEELELEFIVDLLDFWPELSLQTKESIHLFVKHALTALYDNQVGITATFKLIMAGFLHAAGVEKDNELKSALLNLVTYYCQLFGSADMVDLILKHVQISINNPHPQVQRASKDLLIALNPFAITQVHKINDPSSTFVQSLIMASPHTGSFRPVHYEIAMRHLGMASQLIGSDEQNKLTYDQVPSEWARRLIHYCDTFGNLKNVSAYSELNQVNINDINNSEPLLYYWVMWESARYCMLSRLRTPFGGPQQTFAAFERMLQSLLLNENTNQNLDHVRHLLLLLDRLELQISNATDGCATNALPAVPRSSLIFFRTNKKTCHDYFLRIRPNMIAGAKLISNDHMLIYHTQQLLKEMESHIPHTEEIIPWFKELNKYMCDLVEACIKEKYMDLIYGLQAWYKRLIRKASQNMAEFNERWSFEGFIGPIEKKDEDTKTSTTWFQVAAMFASGRDEAAIKSLNALKSVIKTDDFGILKMLEKHAVHFYTCLEDYDALQRMLDAGSTVIDDFICNSLRSFNEDSLTSAQFISATELQHFIQVAPLESCLELARLYKFRDSMNINFDMNSHLTERILQTLKEGIYTNISSLIELQLLETDAHSLVASAKDWLNMSSGYTYHHLPPDTKHWARLSIDFERLHHKNDQLDISHCLGFVQLHSAKVARRQGNIALAETLIKKAVVHADTKYLALYEQTKVSFLQSDYTGAMKTASDVLLYLTSVQGYDELKSKTYLKVARYLKNCPETEVDGLLQQLDPSLVKMEANDLQSSVEVSIDDALQKSIENNTVDGRPWFEYATHFYKQGWRILDELLRPDLTMPIVLWASEKIKSVLKDDSLDTKLIEKTIFNLLSKYSTNFGEKKLGSSGSFVAELHQITPFLDKSSEGVIIEALDVLQTTIVSKFHASTEAYFRYLSLDIHNKNSENNEHISSTSMVITATLRLLRILTRYGESLQSLYTKHINIVRIDLWKPVIPQLFAQLNHPNDFVRSIISKLISRICDEYPREIIYDVIVNSTSTKTNHSTKQNLTAIANRMMDRNELLWVSTSRMAEELEKITVLWEERWLNKIASLQYDAMQQFTKLDQEIERLSKKDEAAQSEKSFLEIYESLMKFVVASIDKLFEETMQQDTTVLTPHEKWFQQTYGKQLTHAYELLQKPTCMKEYRQGWECFQKLHRQLMAETHKFRILELDQVSPYLYNMKNTPIGIPGHHETNASCRIDSFGTNVIILPTKTKPKKLNLRGTDGEKYPYLFKGLEDLHLDERIMQLLTTTNGLLSENGATALRGMRARTYAVIPLSDHSGMIQWVNEATPLFALFKKWQKRESTAHMLLAGDNKPNEAYLQSLMQRPTENFTAKVASVLKSAGLRVTANRRYWPKDVLKRVYLELVKETPGDLIEKEIYYSSSSATEWYKKSTSFARSLAVTCMIGYIIGLGDRHLDNMMVDFRSGEVIHIDYNVCFEKGKRLRVPELVPYRLTQNLYGALGIIGVDGPFKAAAEETLRVLRKHKEVLITLLDAFVYDPLVDWENGTVEAGYRQVMELQANLGLVATRITEKQVEQEKEKKVILVSLSGLKHNLHQWHESVLLEAESFNAEDVSDEEDPVLESRSSLSPLENEAPSFTGRLPMYILREVHDHLNNVVLLVSNTRSSVEGISPLLESIIIIETDADNELRPAQKSAKMALDSLATMDAELKRLDLQLEEKENYESEWSYDQLLEFIQTITKSVQDYFSALKTLEEFGPDNNKNTVTEENEDLNEESQERVVVNANQHASQGPYVNKVPTNTHVTKIMKRIRSKLEGIDFGIQHKMSVNEQVARSIEQATSVDNLCMMYEGWTSWV